MYTNVMENSLTNVQAVGIEFGLIIAAIAVWSIVWKILALWHSARSGHRVWFIIFMLVNTVGILEIIYLFAIRKLKKDELFSRKDTQTKSAAEK